MRRRNGVAGIANSRIAGVVLVVDGRKKHVQTSLDAVVRYMLILESWVRWGRSRRSPYLPAALLSPTPIFIDGRYREETCVKSPLCFVPNRSAVRELPVRMTTLLSGAVAQPFAAFRALVQAEGLFNGGFDDNRRFN